MQIVIDIPEEIYNSACATNNIWDMRMAGFVCSSIANGTPLPKGHGRLVDVDKLVKQYNLDEATKYCNKNAKQQAHSYNTMMFYEIADMIDDAPTIIEADKAESEG